MNLGMLDFDGGVPEGVAFNSLKIALRVMLQSEALDFFMDPRGIVPEHIGRAIHETIPNQYLFLAGHEYAHLALGHLKSANIQDKRIIRSVLQNQKDCQHSASFYSHSQQEELDADVASINLCNYPEDKRKDVFDAALMFYGYLDLFEHVLDQISPSVGLKTHPPARDRYTNLLNKLEVKSSDVRYINFLNLIDYQRWLKRFVLCGSF